MKKIFMQMILLITMTVTGCQANGSSTPEITTNPNTIPYPILNSPTSTTSAYPAPVIIDNTNAYPAPQDTVISSKIPAEKIVPFQIQKPVTSSDTQVVGTGMAGIPIMLVNVTNVGEVIAETTIKDDGTFVFQIQPIDAGYRIGIMLGNLDSTPWSVEDFFNSGFNGSDAANLPNVGFLYDSTMVK